MTKKKIQLSGLHCTSCALSIEWALEDLGAKAKCDYISQTLEVEFDEGKMGEEAIKLEIRKLGYEVVSWRNK